MSLEIQWPGIGSLIPAHAELIKVDSIFGKGPNLLNKLNQGIEELNTGRTILIDCCPFLGVLSLNAIFAADRMLVPVSSDFLSLRGTDRAHAESTGTSVGTALCADPLRSSAQDQFGNTGSHAAPVRQRRVRVSDYGKCGRDGSSGVQPRYFFASGIKPRRGRQCRVDGRADQLRVCLTRNQAGDVFEAADWSAHPAAMTNAFENFAIPIDLPQLPLRLPFITTVNHQAINDQSDPGSDTKAVFRKNGWMHGKAHERQ